MGVRFDAIFANTVYIFIGSAADALTSIAIGTAVAVTGIATTPEITGTITKDKFIAQSASNDPDFCKKIFPQYLNYRQITEVRSGQTLRGKRGQQKKEKKRLLLSDYDMGGANNKQPKSTFFHRKESNKEALQSVKELTICKYLKSFSNLSKTQKLISFKQFDFLNDKFQKDFNSLKFGYELIGIAFINFNITISTNTQTNKTNSCNKVTHNNINNSLQLKYHIFITELDTIYKNLKYINNLEFKRLKEVA
jgi:hypothetical protein